MPATQGYRLDDWREPPMISAKHGLEAAPDGRVFKIYEYADVAASILEYSEDIDTYRWELTDDQLEALALESARHIVETRRELLLERQAELRRLAEVQDTNVIQLDERRDPEPIPTVYVATRYDATTGVLLR